MATATGGATATASDDTTVSITNAVPVVTLAKTAAPASLPAPGGSFTFTVVVGNGGAEPFTVAALTDDVYGSLWTQGTCNTAVGTVVAPAGTYTCSFTGTFTGGGGRPRRTP